ncbi:penicillin-binding protein 2 [Mucilaginibacter yixingensis]|uniref:Penicillin-binding protein 2 n=1 Tax=Mucilaginibacter yixingensis TaxID=1295612 RepID=A0A2T5JBS7_9SPHI|nr:penicillin-binding protein 2 [Mucilaginibacter yixingensis]PTQ99221.1 penicillin-binding protein 2 [Mucilaginibacter yixingensis]
MNSFFARRYVITGIFITLAFVLLARLFYIQIIDDRYMLFAKNNVVRTQIQYPARGVILDRNGKLLVDNQPVYDVMVTPKAVKPFDTVEFCKLLDIDKPTFDKYFDKAEKYSPSQRSIFQGQLDSTINAKLGERIAEFPGFELVLRSVRSYPDSIAGQFLGYIGQANDATIAKSNGYYHPGDYVGISGVEKSYETELRGQRGVQNILVDSRGREKGRFANGMYDTAAVAGERLKSSLDSRIQKLGEQLMRNKVGSIVAIEPSTGEILCFVSSPTYNPNLMVGREHGNNYMDLLRSPNNPLLVRPIQARYPPGSSFKPLSALIALQEGVITPQTTYNCPGYYVAGNRRVPCFHNERHGTVNLASAVAESCNGYFDMVFERLINRTGPKNTDTSFTSWRTNVAKFGLGAKLDLDLPGETGGLLPKASLYDKWYGRGGWRSSTVISLGIGQGELEATPLQLANIEATIANHGFFYKPHLIKAIGEKQVVKAEFTQKNYVGIEPQYFEPVIDGMQAVVDRGTAVGSRIPGIVMCGKTGTAQIRHQDNSVFVAFAPRDNPKIAIAVVVEGGGQGARWAAPIASFIVEKYLRDSITRRPSGIEPGYFMNASVLPQPAKPKPAPVKAKPDSTAKPAQAALTAGKHKKKKQPVVYAAAILKGDDDE